MTTALRKSTCSFTVQCTVHLNIPVDIAISKYECLIHAENFQYGLILHTIQKSISTQYFSFDFLSTVKFVREFLFMCVRFCLSSLPKSWVTTFDFQKVKKILRHH
jgi:hypothetical protein